MNKHIAMDSFAYFCFCALVGTGLLLEFRLCEDANGTILGLAAEEWSEIHEWVAYAFIAAVILHLALHWAWIKKLANRQSWGTVIGLSAGVCMIGVLFLSPVQESGRSHYECSSEETQEQDD